MSPRGRRGATYDDVAAAPPDKIAETVEGDLYLSPRPAPRHANAAASLTADLHDAFQRGRRGPGGWWILFEPELHLGDDVLVPDIAGWRRERLAELPETAWFELPPDWLCEVISPSTEILDRDRKLPAYAAAGVAHVWIVDAARRTLEILRREGSTLRLVTTYRGAALISEPPFDAVTIELGALWT
ncbi:MAG: Uma2 family endonuclease [Thermoanaerobaculia bacterium]